MLYFVLKLVEVLFKLMKAVLILSFFLVLIGFLLPYMTNVSSFKYMHYIELFNYRLDALIQAYIPTRIYSYNITHFVVLFLSIILIPICGKCLEKVHYWSAMCQFNRGRDRIAKTTKGMFSDKKVAILDKKMQETESANLKDRKTLMREFVEIKQKLENMRRELAFLSIDVVDATGMKKDEDPIVVSRDFIEYRNFIEKTFKEHKCVKSTWTPDGVMACFNTAENAFATAKAIIEGLTAFNQNVKVMKRNFAVRCGINTGFLLFDVQTPLEEMSDQVIDIAGNMQKYADPNSIYLAKDISGAINLPVQLVPTDKVIDNHAVCKWEPIPNTPQDAKLNANPLL